LRCSGHPGGDGQCFNSLIRIFGDH
jgi:hypothetical protein